MTTFQILLFFPFYHTGFVLRNKSYFSCKFSKHWKGNVLPQKSHTKCCSQVCMSGVIHSSNLTCHFFSSITMDNCVLAKLKKKKNLWQCLTDVFTVSPKYPSALNHGPKHMLLNFLHSRLELGCNQILSYFYLVHISPP